MYIVCLELYLSIYNHHSSNCCCCYLVYLKQFFVQPASVMSENASDPTTTTTKDADAAEKCVTRNLGVSTTGTNSGQHKAKPAEPGNVPFYNPLLSVNIH